MRPDHADDPRRGSSSAKPFNADAALRSIAVLHRVLDEGAVREVTRRAETGFAELFSRPEVPAAPLLDGLAQVYLRALLSWLGIPLDGQEARRRAEQLTDVVGISTDADSLESALLACRDLDRWATGIACRAQAGELPGTLIESIALRHGPDGQPTDAALVGLAMVDLLREASEAAYLGVFAAVALERSPRWRSRIHADEATAAGFASAVRRALPFFSSPSESTDDTEDTYEQAHLSSEGGGSTDPDSTRLLDRLVAELEPRSTSGVTVTDQRRRAPSLTDSLLAMTSRTLAWRTGWSVLRSDEPSTDHTRPRLRVVREPSDPGKDR